MAADPLHPPQKALVTRVTITDIDIPFRSMVMLLLTAAFASVPAAIALMIIGALVALVFGGALATL